MIISDIFAIWTCHFKTNLSIFVIRYESEIFTYNLIQEIA